VTRGPLKYAHSQNGSKRSYTDAHNRIGSKRIAPCPLLYTSTSPASSHSCMLRPVVFCNSISCVMTEDAGTSYGYAENEYSPLQQQCQAIHITDKTQTVGSLTSSSSSSIIPPSLRVILSTYAAAHVSLSYLICSSLHASHCTPLVIGSD
jgi:hypothetical protein